MINLKTIICEMSEMDFFMSFKAIRGDKWNFSSCERSVGIKLPVNRQLKKFYLCLLQKQLIA